MKHRIETGTHGSRMKYRIEIRMGSRKEIRIKPRTNYRIELKYR